MNATQYLTLFFLLSSLTILYVAKLGPFKRP